MSVQEYVVELLIRHEITVTTIDDVQAQIEAYRALGPTLRARVVVWRVCDERDRPLEVRDPDRTQIEGSWSPPDREWLEGNIVD